MGIGRQVGEIPWTGILSRLSYAESKILHRDFSCFLVFISRGRPVAALERQD